MSLKDNSFKKTHFDISAQKIQMPGVPFSKFLLSLKKNYFFYTSKFNFEATTKRFIS